MTAYTTEIHLRERTDSTPEERLFDGWLAGTTNLSGVENNMCAMTSRRSIKWCCDVEKRAFQLSGKMVNYDGTPSDSTIETVRVYENFS